MSTRKHILRLVVPIVAVIMVLFGLTGVASATTTSDTSGAGSASQSGQQVQGSTGQDIGSSDGSATADTSQQSGAQQQSQAQDNTQGGGQQGTDNGQGDAQSGTSSNQASLSVDLSIDHDVIQLGQSANLNWQTTGDVVALTASGDWSGEKDFPTGTETVTPSSIGSFTYTLTAKAACGCKKTSSVKLTVVPAPQVIVKQPVVVIIAPKCVNGHLGDVLAQGKDFGTNLSGVQSFFYADSAHASDAVGTSTDSQGNITATVPATGKNLGSLTKGSGVFVFDTTKSDKDNGVRVEVNFLFNCTVVVVTPPSQQPSPSPSPVPPTNVTTVVNNTNTNTVTHTVVVKVPSASVGTPSPASQFVAPSGYAHAAPTGGTGTSLRDNTGLLAGVGAGLLMLAVIAGILAIRRRSHGGSEA